MPSVLSNERDAWAHTSIALLGVWLLVSPVTLGYAEHAIAWSDYASGALTLALGLMAMRARLRWWAQWGIAILGVWVIHAPLFLWAESAAAYLNSTVVGILLIAFAVAIPRSIWNGDQRISNLKSEIADTPPGWSFNPSSWVQRAPIIALAWINFFAARYMATYQLEHIEWPWDPFFGDGTHLVLTSDVSEAFPVSDAGLGAAAYAIEALIGYMGSASRWRTAPWTVALFGVLVVPVGIVSTILLMLQPLAVGAWCSLCLFTAALMLLMAALALPEVAAMIEFLLRCRRRGESVWRVFWRGGDDPDAHGEDPRVSLATSSFTAILRGMVSGMSVQGNIAASLALGVWVMIAPVALAVTGAAENAHYVIGALIAITAIISMAEVTRIARFGNILFALAIAAAPWLMEGSNMAAQINGMVVALALIALSMRRGAIVEQYGEWARWIR